jgi:hypothetical protein
MATIYFVTGGYQPAPQCSTYRPLAAKWHHGQPGLGGGEAALRAMIRHPIWV